MRKAVNAIFIVYGLLQQWIEPTLYHIRGEHARHCHHKGGHRSISHLLGIICRFYINSWVFVKNNCKIFNKFINYNALGKKYVFYNKSYITWSLMNSNNQICINNNLLGNVHPLEIYF